VQGLDFSILERAELEQGRACQLRIHPASLLSAGRALSRIELRAGSVDPYGVTTLEFELERDGVLSGFVGWFKAELTDEVVLETGPEQSETHWLQTYFAFPPRPVKAGAKLQLRSRLARDPADRRAVLLSIDVGDGERTYRAE
jgi:hypothetical protein